VTVLCHKNPDCAYSYKICRGLRWTNALSSRNIWRDYQMFTVVRSSQ